MAAKRARRSRRKRRPDPEPPAKRARRGRDTRRPDPEPVAKRARRARPARRPDPEPIEVDDSLVIAVGTALWAIAWIVLLVFYGKLEDHGNEWYPWTAAAGLGLGLWGWFLVRKRIAAREAARVADTLAGPRRRRRAVG